MTTTNKQPPAFNSALGFLNTIECFGHSLMKGDGNLSGLTAVTQLQVLFPDRIVNNKGISGQTSTQIAARQGGVPVVLTATGNSLSSMAAVAVTAISSQFLSTPTDDASRYMGGQINGGAVIVERTASGGPPSTTETYNVYGISIAGAIPARAVFVPDDAWNARHAVQVLWMCNNDDLSDLTIPLANVAACYAYAQEPKRVIVVGEHPNPSATTGTTRYNQVLALNTALAAAYPGYVSSQPPTVAEMTAVGYTPTTQDNTDIANGVWPTGLHSAGDTVHLLDQGYQIVGNRIGAAILALGW